MRWGWRPYVSVAQRRAKASRYTQQLQKKGRKVCPIRIDGRTIAKTFWGKAWCDNLESYSDYSNRLPRGRTYVRNGSVVDLQIKAGHVQALVSGSNIYRVSVRIAPAKKSAWQFIRKECAGSIDSLIDLLRGRFAESVMAKLTCQQRGLFPKPKEIEFQCSCPDSASMCKHVAAVLYGIGARLDEAPELLFAMRDVDHRELIAEAADASRLETAIAGSASLSLQDADLSEVFGIDLDFAPTTHEKGRPEKRKPDKSMPATARRRAATKQTTSPSSATKGLATKTSARKKTAKSTKTSRKKAART